MIEQASSVKNNPQCPFTATEIILPGIVDGGTMVSYALMSKTNSNTIRMKQFMYLVCRVLLLNILVNGKNTACYDIWSGKGTDKFRAKMKEDFASLMNLLLQNKLKPKIATTFSLTDISKAMEFAESRTAYGKVVLVP